MIKSKSQFFKSAIAALAAIPVAAAATFTTAGSAEAYTGGFTFDGTGTTADLNNLGITFAPNPGNIVLGVKSGDFLGDTTGNIFSFLNANLPLNPQFIEIGPIDGVKLLSLTNLDAPVFQGGTLPGLSDIRYDFTGSFEDSSNANGFVTFSTLLSAADAQTAFGLGQTITASFSGATITVNNVTVPEPATLLGLGIVAAGMAVSRRRKTIPQ